MWHKGSLGDEDDARTSNTKQSQHNSVVITLTRGRHVPASKHALVLRTSVMLVSLLVILWYTGTSSEYLGQVRVSVNVKVTGVKG